MENPALRELASAYARGKISRVEYLESRSRLINSIVAGDVAGAPPAQTPDTVTNTPTQAPPPGGRRFRVDALAGIAALLGLALGLYWYLQPAPREEMPTSISPVTVQPGVKLLEGFLTAATWNPASEQQLLRNWKGLDGQTRTLARRSPAYRQLKDALYQALLEEQALAELDESAGDYEHLQSLLDLAGGMGLEDARYGEAQAWLEKQRASQHPKPANAGKTAAPTTTQTAVPQPTSRTKGSPPRTSSDTHQSERPTTRPAVAAAETTTVETPASSQVATRQQDTASHTSPVTPAAAPAVPTAVSPAPASPERPAPESVAKPTQNLSGKQRQSATDSKKTSKARRHGCTAELARTRKPYCRDSIKGDGKGPLMVVLPAGSFVMGGERPDEQPRHEVRLTSAFAMSLYEITQQQFARYCASSKRTCPPQPWSGKDLPVVNISWHDARAYCKWLSGQTSRHYRLPVEAEWEYAARAGARGRYPEGDELLPTQARFSYQAVLDKPLPRGDHSVNRNRFRLYHMLGNVREWVLDSWHDSYQGAPQTAQAFGGGGDRRVVRGGSYHDRAEALTLASRIPQPASGGDRYTGFRIVRIFTAGQETNGQAWLAAQRPDMLTLQLFAGRNIHTMEGLIAAHRELDIHVLPTATATVNYRVIYGIFSDRQQAKQAFDRLPVEISRLAGRPIIKTIADLRAKR